MTHMSRKEFEKLLMEARGLKNICDSNDSFELLKSKRLYLEYGIDVSKHLSILDLIEYTLLKNEDLALEYLFSDVYDTEQLKEILLGVIEGDVKCFDNPQNSASQMRSIRENIQKISLSKNY